MSSALIVHSGSVSNYPSGEWIVAQREAASLRKLGIKVDLIHYRPTSKRIEGIAGKAKLAFKNIWSIHSAKVIEHEIERYEPDIVHFHGLTPFLSGAALKAAHDTGVPVVQTLHNGRWLCLEGGFYRDGQYCDLCVDGHAANGIKHGCNNGVLASSLFYAANRSALFGGRLFQWVDRFIAVSEFIKDQHVRGGFPAEKIVVKYNGLELNPLHKGSVGPRSRSSVAFVSRISAAKGIGILQYLISVLPYTFNIVGDGPDLLHLKEFCKINGLKNARFFGQLSQEECLEVLASADCSLVPSQCGEAFPLTAIESMAVSTPVVASAIGGLADLIKASKGGICVPPQDLEKFAETVRYFLENPSVATEYACAGRRYVESTLDGSTLAKQLLDIYESVIQEKARC